MCGAVGTNIDKTAFTWSCVDIQLVWGLNYINSLIGCMVTNTSSGYTACISTLQWITAKNPLTTSWMYSTPDPNVKWIHSSSELWVWISGPEAVIIHRFPPNTCCRCLKKARLCFWDENPKLHWRKKNTLARDARSATRVFSNQRHPAWLQSFPFFSAEPCLREGSVRWVRAELGSAVVVLVHNLIQCVGSSR